MAFAHQSKIVNSRGRHLRVVHRDGWENAYTGHGTTRDKLTAGTIQPVAPSTDWQTWDDLYHGDDLAARIVDELVDDMMRKWIRLQVTMREDADADANVEAANAMMGALKDLKAKKAIHEALTWANVFGGSIIFVGADDGGGSDPESMAQPLRENAIRSIKFLDVYDRADVEIETEYSDPLEANFRQPETYRIRDAGSTRGTVQTPPLVIHESRTLRFDGARVNRRRLIRNNGWHDPIFVRIQERLRDFGISWSSAAHLLADFAPMVFTSPGLSDSLAMDGPAVILDRLTQMDMCRSTVRMTPIDEGETLERKATPLTGMDGLLALWILRICSAARMPVTKLFGQSPSGLNTTAEGDLTFWYDRVASHQEADLRGQLERLIDLLWLAKDGPTGGAEPKSWNLEFEQLWQLSADEDATARKTQAETDAVYIDTGVLMADEVARSRFGGDRYSFETTLDEEARAEAELEPDEPESEPTPMPETVTAMVNGRPVQQGDLIFGQPGQPADATTTPDDESEDD